MSVRHPYDAYYDEFLRRIRTDQEWKNICVSEALVHFENYDMCLCKATGTEYLVKCIGYTPGVIGRRGVVVRLKCPKCQTVALREYKGSHDK